MPIAPRRPPRDRAELLARIDTLKVWSRGDQRAPHKPLLILFALGRFRGGLPRLVSYVDVDTGLGRLLADFGPARDSHHPEYPFWRLQQDGLWIVEPASDLTLRSSNSDPLKSELIEKSVPGGFTREVVELLEREPGLVHEIANRVLARSFPESLHEEILSAVGLDRRSGMDERRRRDPGFRDAVLRAYGRRCAVCGLDLRLDDTSVALDAAHIRWHQAKGPDRVDNGLALCSLHHRLFDRGAFSLADDRLILVSQAVNGSDEGLDFWLRRFSRKPLRAPHAPDHLPAPRHADWHRREVFRGAAL